MKKTKLLKSELTGGGYHLFLTVKVNDVRCRFLLDTGASNTVVDKGFFVKKFGAKKVKTIKQETTGLHSSVSESYYAAIKKLSVGKIESLNCNVALIDLSHVNSTYAKIKQPKIHGIIGSDFLLKFKAIIDYGELSIKLFA